MSSSQKTVTDLIEKGYQHGFFTDIESDTVAPGLDEETICLISARKQEPVGGEFPNHAANLI